jgi:hypothetical protein
MATEDLTSLFGQDPRMLQQAMDLQMAQLDPAARAYMQGASAGRSLGQVAGNLFGVDVQDPMIKQATQLRALASEYDTTTPEGLMEFGKAASKINPKIGFQAQQQALGLLKEQSVISKNLRERAAADPIQQLLRTGKFTSKSIAEYAKTGNIEDLDNVDKADPTAITEANGKVLLINKQTGATIRELGSAPQRGTVLNVDAKGEAEFSKELGKLDAKKVSDAQTARDNAFSTVRSLNQLAALDDQGLISGSFASGRVGVTNLLNTLGLTSVADQQKLASSQNYQKVAGDVILGTLGGKLGAGFSNEDRKFIESLVPQLETSPSARRQLINFMRTKNMDIAEEATRMENYARENKGLSGFKPKINLGQQNTYSSMGVDELAKAAGGTIVNGKFVPNK